MCVALPGIVESIDENDAVVNFSENKVKAALGFVEPKIGDRVLVHAGYIMQIISKSEADELAELLDEIKELV